MINIVEAVSEDIFISPTGCSGILRRANMRNQFINQRLKKYLVEGTNFDKKIILKNKESTTKKRYRYWIEDLIKKDSFQEVLC